MYYAKIFPSIAICYSLAACTRVKDELVSAATESRASSGSGPSERDQLLTFSKVVHDFGSIDQGEVAEASFKFSNENTKNVRIDSSRNSCGCTSPEIEVEGKGYVFGTPIARGAFGQLRVKMKTGGIAGHQISTVYLEIASDQSDRLNVVKREIAIQMRAVVVPAYTFNPSSYVVLGNISNRDKISREVTLQRGRGKPFTINGFEKAEGDGLRFESFPLDDAKTSWKIILNMERGRPVGAFTRSVKVLTVPPAEVSLSVMGIVHSLVYTEPHNLLSFGVVAKGKEHQRTLRVKCSDETVPLNILNIRLLENNLKTSFNSTPPIEIPLDPDAAHNIRVIREEQTEKSFSNLIIQLKSSIPAGALSFKLKFDTGIAEEPESMAIIVNAFVK